MAFLLQNHVEAQNFKGAKTVNSETHVGVGFKRNKQSIRSNREVSQAGDVEQNRPDSDQKDKTEPLDFSALGRSGQQTAGESRGSCPFVDHPLTAIAPKSNVSKTTSSHPRLWFYLPYDVSKVSKLEFSIVDQHGNDVTRLNLSIPDNPSYISAALPKTTDGLGINNPYTWHLKVYCNAGKKSTVPVFVSGALVRVANNSSHAKSLKFSTQNIKNLVNEGLWIDAVSVLFHKGCQHDLAKKKPVWNSLLKSSKIDLELPDPLKVHIQTP